MTTARSVAPPRPSGASFLRCASDRRPCTTPAPFSGFAFASLFEGGGERQWKTAVTAGARRLPAENGTRMFNRVRAHILRTDSGRVRSDVGLPVDNQTRQKRNVNRNSRSMEVPSRAWNIRPCGYQSRLGAWAASPDLAYT